MVAFNIENSNVVWETPAINEGPNYFLTITKGLFRDSFVHIKINKLSFIARSYLKCTL